MCCPEVAGAPELRQVRQHLRPAVLGLHQPLVQIDGLPLLSNFPNGGWPVGAVVLLLVTCTARCNWLPPSPPRWPPHGTCHLGCVPRSIHVARAARGRAPRSSPSPARAACSETHVFVPTVTKSIKVDVDSRARLPTADCQHRGAVPVAIRVEYIHLLALEHVGGVGEQHGLLCCFFVGLTDTVYTNQQIRARILDCHEY